MMLFMCVCVIERRVFVVFEVRMLENAKTAFLLLNNWCKCVELIPFGMMLSVCLCVRGECVLAMVKVKMLENDMRPLLLLSNS
jgi:hypothetical protein